MRKFPRIQTVNPVICFVTINYSVLC